jgi:hypothetical protein
VLENLIERFWYWDDEALETVSLITLDSAVLRVETYKRLASNLSKVETADRDFYYAIGSNAST